MLTPEGMSIHCHIITSGNHERKTSEKWNIGKLVSGMPSKEGGGPLNNLLSGGDTSTRQFIPSHPIPSQSICSSPADALLLQVRQEFICQFNRNQMEAVSCQVYLTLSSTSEVPLAPNQQLIVKY